MKKIYIITDRKLNHSDSISRYIIDLANGLSKYTRVVVFTTDESKTDHTRNGDYTTKFQFKVINGLPPIDDIAIYHFHLTFSIRDHTKFLLDNIEHLKDKSVVTFHVDPKYAKAMGQEENVEKILRPIIDNNILGYVFSSYSKVHLEKYGMESIWVIYPGLDLSVYEKYKCVQKKDKILFVASNTDNTFIGEIKGLSLIEYVENILSQKYVIEKIINAPFEEYLTAMAEAKFYLALGSYEHYGFAITDAFNLGTIPIYNNRGGLTESVYGKGFPLFVKEKSILNGMDNIVYDMDLVGKNYIASKLEHDINRHVTCVLELFELIK